MAEHLIKGKAYANRKSAKNRPKGDLYHTPKSLIWTAEGVIKKEFRNKEILEPCCGNGAISEELIKMGYSVLLNDLHTDKGSGVDYLEKIPYPGSKYVISNPPFSLWDGFVNQSKTHCKKFMYIGRLNYLGTDSRLKSGIWKNLKWILPFSRYVDYQTPYREDGLFHVGALATGFFLWDMKYKKPPMMKILDVQNYAKLGAFRGD